MAVFKPLKVVIINYPYQGPREVQAPNFPSDHSKGYHSTTFDREIWIERTDFQEVPEKGFRRLTLNQGVGIKYTGLIIELEEIVKSSSGEIDHLKVRCIPVNEGKKPRAFIHWVTQPVKAEVRLFENLFKSERPDDPKCVPQGFLSDVNPASLKKLPNVLIGKSSLNAFKHYQRFQFERTGYFAVDPGSNSDQLIFNRIIPLKQDKGFR